MSEQTAPSATLPIGIVADLCSPMPDDADPVDRYLVHVYWRDVLQRAAKQLTAECGSDLARMAAKGMGPAQIRDALAEHGVELSDDGVRHLLALADKPSATRTQ